jgi:DnaJ-class molecular chaperone
VSSRRRRTEVERPKLVFGVHELCRSCRATGKVNGMICRVCKGERVVEIPKKKEDNNGQG